MQLIRRNYMALTKTTGHISLLVANIIFGLNTTISRSIIPEIIDPYLLTFFRMAGAAVLFWVLSIFVKNEKVPTKDIIRFFFASILALVTNQIPFIVGLSLTSPIDASVVVTMLPIMTMIFAAFIIKEPITLLKAIGVLVGATGALVLIVHSSGADGGGNMVGNLILLISISSFGLYLTLFKDLISRYSSVTSMKWMFLFATIMTLPFSYKPTIHTDFAALDASVYLRIVYIVCLATFFTYMLLPIGQKTLRPTTLSMYNYLQPITATFAAVIVGMDKLSVQTIVSTILVFSGVYIVTQSKSRAQLETEKKVKK